MPIQGVIVLAGRAVAGEVVRRMEAAGYPEIRPSHSPVFGALPPEGARLTQMAERAQMTKQAMGELIDDLVGLGLVTRVPDPDDKRAKIVRFTAKGLRAAETGRRLYEDIERDLARRLGRAEMKLVREALVEIAAAFGVR